MRHGRTLPAASVDHRTCSSTVLVTTVCAAPTPRQPARRTRPEDPPDEPANAAGHAAYALVRVSR